MDEILRKAALPGRLHLHEMPYDTAFSRIVDLWYEGAVYGVVLNLDGSGAHVDSYWGNTQLQVIGENTARAEQLEALKTRWKVVSNEL
ncbi:MULTISPECIES: hypothetical protein [Streptomyces]|uniref:DUF5753 domain-containing protein n=2 Tax=Streptomyces TaxID=1883 RepID=A0ABV9IS61_9ACTN